ncbi:MAG: ATP-binding protein [Thermodesulfovibrionia bacterium]
MIGFQPSIRKKVKFAYYFGITLISIIAIINILNLRTLNKKIAFSFVISELFDITLEMRRFEKNYFLYRHREDYLENLKFTEKAEDIISKNKEAIKGLSIRADVYVLESNIQEYKSLMQRHFQLSGTSPYEASDLETKIRERGKDLVTQTESISMAERGYIQSLINTSQKIFITSGIFLIIVGFFIAEYLSRMVAKPLKQLENSMQKFANGEFSFIPVISRDKELMSLSKAFNTMLVELELRQRHLIQSEKLASLGTLLFGVAHELNNPLNNISTSCQILREELETADPEFKKELLSQIESETDRARDIVRSILDYSKTGTREVVNISNLVREAIKFIKAEVPPKVELALEIPEDITVKADPQQLKQVFLNLIKNSIEAMDGEGKVTISAKHHHPHIEIRVTDTGKGMSQEVLSKIFDPFFTTKEGGKGYGLGLFVTQNIIKEHGGTIDVQSSPGHGTTFLIRLPEREDEG